MPRSSSYKEQEQSRKRRRKVISCMECHRRKQKCDRHSPCRNCIRRGKQAFCHYNSASESHQNQPSSSNGIDPSSVSNSSNSARLISSARSNSENIRCDIQCSLQGLGYSGQSNNSMGLLKTTELHRDQHNSLANSHTVEKPIFRNDTSRRYLELVRRLPPQPFIDVLIQTFLTLVNWQYDLLDDKLFQEQLKSWRSVSYSGLQENLAAFTPETLVFPALLLQVLAQAILVHSPHDKAINGLVVLADMTFHDLAAEYSNAGADVLLLLGKGRITMATVQAGLLRASFLKSSGKVVDAWHALGATIRDAQEIGLHTGRIERRAHFDGTEEEMQHFSNIGPKIWVVLHIWDAHMAVVLGRPMATSLQLENLAHTVRDNERRRELFSHWKTEDDQPRPFDIIIAGYVVAYRYFQDVHHLEHRTSELYDDTMVECMHARIIGNLKMLPSWCRLENPSGRFDKAYGCQWLPAAREQLYSLVHLVLLTLHRPYIFSKANSRTEALKAGISILSAQDRLFQQSEPHQHNLFTPVYASFDAIVLIAAICLAFPNEDRELRAEGIKSAKSGIEILDKIGRSNSMARSAHGVASSLYDRLMHYGYEQIPPNDHSDLPSLALSEYSFDTIPPPRPIHDLFYDHITSTSIFTAGTQLNRSSDSSFTGDIADSWNFEGIFSDDSFWGVLNESHPDT